MSAFEWHDALVVSATFLRAVFGGSSAVYSLRLGQPCSSAVVVHLLLPSDAIGSVRLSSDRICFTPDNFCAPQLVRVDALDNRTQWSVITHRLFSLDRNYDRAVAPNIVVQTEATLAECPLLTFGGLVTKHRTTAKGLQQAARLDIQAALPEETSSDPTEAASQDASWCVSHMACGSQFSVAAVARPKGNVLLSWGINTNGELGNGTMTSSPTPQQVITFPMRFQRELLAISHVSCGKHHAAVITGQARLFTWGCNKFGQLGLGDFASRTRPHEVHFALATLSSHRRALRVMHTVQRGGNNVTHVACGAAHTLFVTHQQQILGMGCNQAGQLGLGHRLQQRKGWRSCTPIAVESLRDQSILDLAAGQNHSACVLSSGDVYTWGCGDDGRLGNDKLGEGVPTPMLVASLREAAVRARAVRCGARHMAVLSDSDLVYIWGANDFGQLGSKDKKPRSRPYLLATSSLVAEGVVDIALGEFHSTCMTLTGRAYTWGLNLRHDSALVGSHDSPQWVGLPEEERVRKISCGWAHSNVITHVAADEASALGQGTNFDRKMERERLLQRKDEVERWRAFVATTVSPTTRVDSRDLSRAVKEKDKLSPGSPSTTERFGADGTPKKLAAKFVDKDTKKRGAYKTNTQAKRREGTLEHPSLQLKGIFYRNELHPPELPPASVVSPLWASPHRRLWDATTAAAEVPHPGASHSTPFQSSQTGSGMLKPSILENRMPNTTDKSDSCIRDSAYSSSKFIVGAPAFKRTVAPSLRNQIEVVEALMHRPSYSIAQSAIASARPRESY